MTEGTNETHPGKNKQFTEDTRIVVTDPLEVDEVFLEAMADTDLMRIEYGEEGDIIENCEIDPRVLRSAMFLYSSMERTRHDWR